MDELVDFEELIDLNLSLPSVSQSSQEPIADVLDKMCEAMDERDISINDVLKNDENENDEIVPDDDIVNLDDFENLLATSSLCNDEDSLVTDDMLEINEKENAEIVPNDVVNLDEFETLLDTADLCNDERNAVADDISAMIDNDMVKMPVDAINLDDFESISANACFFIDEEDTTDKGNNNVSNVQRVSSYEVPVEFENACGRTTEHDVIKQENIPSNKYTVHTISLASTTASNESENCINLDTANLISNKVKTVNKQYDNGLATVKLEPNITEDILTLTINNNEVKYQYAEMSFKTICKNTIETVTNDTDENKNTESDDGYDSSDFEFISEREASKAGIYTRISKLTINKTNSTAQSISKYSILTQHEQQNTPGQSTSNNIENRIGKNEASLSDYIKYSKYRYQRCYSRPASELHVIPEGERYLDMFRGEYAPVVLNNLYSLRNKRVLSAVAMAANFEELACRDHQDQVDENNETFKDEADDCLEKILSTYRYENRRKRRRH